MSKLSPQAHDFLADRHLGGKVMRALDRGEGVIVYPENLNAIIADALSSETLPFISREADNVTSRSPSPEHMRMALIMCADTFRFYAKSHRAKGTPDGDEKAVRNDDMAAMCERAIGRSQADTAERSDLAREASPIHGKPEGEVGE